MSNMFSRWYQRYLSDPEGMVLALLLLGGLLTVLFMGKMLAPLLCAVVIAYLLEGPVMVLEGVHWPRIWAVLAIYLPFTLLFFILVLGLTPILIAQITDLLREVPNMLARGQDLLQQLPDRYPHLVTQVQLNQMQQQLASTLAPLSQNLISASFTYIGLIFNLLIFLILVPVLLFFMMKDKTSLMTWISALLPRERALALRIWCEMDVQIGNYVRGKMSEIFIVAVVSYIVFAIMGLNYAALMAVLVGLSVIIPYVGATVITFPVALIGYFQWGLGNDFTYLMVAYFILQAIDGNVLVPWLFSEAVNLHPVAIIAAILVFGGFWGLWGVFFAIPLATLVKALLDAWPRSEPISATIPRT